VQILAVGGITVIVGDLAQIAVAEPAVAPADLLQAGDLQALIVLNGLYEVTGLKKAVVGTGVKPGEATPEFHHLQLAGLEIGAVHGGDLDLAAP
jgi:hypothetical protein